MGKEMGSGATRARPGLALWRPRSEQSFYIILVDAVNKKILLTRKKPSNQWVLLQCRIESAGGAARQMNASSIIALEISRRARLLIGGVPKHTVVSGQPVALFSVHASDMKAFHQIKLRDVRWFGRKDKIKKRHVDKLCQKIMQHVFKLSRRSVQAISNDLSIVLRDKFKEKMMDPDPSIGVAAGSGVLVARVALKKVAPGAAHGQEVPIRHVSLGSGEIKTSMTCHAAIRSAQRGITKEYINYIVNKAKPVAIDKKMFRFEYDGTTIVASKTKKDGKRYCIISAYGRSDAIPDPNAAKHLLPQAKNRKLHNKKHRHPIKYMTGEVDDPPHVGTSPVTTTQAHEEKEADSSQLLSSSPPDNTPSPRDLPAGSSSSLGPAPRRASSRRFFAETSRQASSRAPQPVPIVSGKPAQLAKGKQTGRGDAKRG